jgi:FKBP-type peptidyl-prolyl cis-trans isomerase SlyD
MGGRALGERFTIDVPPEQAYGPRDPSKVSLASRASFPDDIELQQGMQFLMQGEEGEEVPVWIAGIEGEKIVVDANHPLCGVDLRFEIEVVAIREASAQERQAGVARGGGGALG